MQEIGARIDILSLDILYYKYCSESIGNYGRMENDRIYK